MAAAAAAEVELPEEIMTDILVRLPVKCLVRFRCVSKPWRSLMNHPFFIRKQLNYATNIYNSNDMGENGYGSDVLYIPTTTKFTLASDPTAKINTTSFKYLEIYQEEEGNHPKITSSVKVLDCPPELCTSCHIRACCDGILCIEARESLHLWNPSIQVYKTLPLAPIRWYWPDKVGIGYDPTIDDYKVLSIPSEASASHCSVEVLSLKSNSWKTVVLGKFMYKWICSRYPTFTNGGIHWLAKRADTRGEMIIYFDVVGEKFGEVPLPPLGSGSTSGLQLLRGNLCVAQDKPESLFEFWVMKKYGVRESWIKLMTVPNFPQFLYSSYVLAIPICFTRTGIVLSIPITGEFVMYNTNDETFEKIFIGGLGIIFGQIPFVESLVSPSADWYA